MIKNILIAFGIVTFPISAAYQSAAADNYSIIERYKGPDGGYDYISIDVAAQRVFVGREYGVLAIDLESKTVIPKLMEANDVAAVLIIPETELMLSTIWGDNHAVLFNRKTGKVIAKIPTGKEPDGALYEKTSDLVFVMNGASEDITIIDIKQKNVIKTIPVGGKPEAAVADGKGRVYINIEDTAEIVVIDVKSLSIQARFTMPGCIEPTGIAYDDISGLLISSCHNGIAKLTQATNGADKGFVTIGQNADGAIFDPVRRQVYIPCMDGTLSIFSLDNKGQAGNIRVVKTQYGARTIGMDPVSGTLYLPATDYETNDKGEEVRKAGTFNVLVVK
ncbi:MAG: hypothetical protein JKY45_14875 [Emcibacter sp.]|nr:hypothetical protein [Emcibacter sp.]